MATPLMQIEGTWEEIVARAAELRGHRLRVMVLPDEQAEPGAGPAAAQPVEKAEELPPNVHLSEQREGAAPGAGQASTEPSGGAGETLRASPSARSAARRLGVKLEDVVRAFPGKLLTDRDVEKFAGR